MADGQIDTKRIDDAVLALMFLTLHDPHRASGTERAWKSFDRDALDRLADQGLILDPVNRSKSVVLTPDGRRRSEELFRRLFTRSG